MLLPPGKFALKIMSFEFVMEGNKALIWRGPLVAKTSEQLSDVMWGNLDYLVSDLPPGTGDPFITIAQSMPSVAVVMVTTPQEVPLADVRRATHMFEEMNIGICGIVENMPYYSCSHSRERIAILGSGGGEILSGETPRLFLVSLRFDPSYGVQSFRRNVRMPVSTRIETDTSIARCRSLALLIQNILNQGGALKVLCMISTDDAETAYNAVRLANVAVRKGDEVSMFMLGEGVLFEKNCHEPFNVMAQLLQFDADFYV